MYVVMLNIRGGEFSQWIIVDCIMHMGALEKLFQPQMHTSIFQAAGLVSLLFEVVLAMLLFEGSMACGRLAASFVSLAFSLSVSKRRFSATASGSS